MWVIAVCPAGGGAYPDSRNPSAVDCGRFPGGKSAAGEYLKADPRRDERDFVTANFRERHY